MRPCVDLNLHCELIDTLWNVNENGVVMDIFAGSGINRYIMECKFYSIRRQTAQSLELIDTLWNVNQLVLTMDCRCCTN